MPVKRDRYESSISDLRDMTGKAWTTITKRLASLKPLRETGNTVIYRTKDALELIYGAEDPLAEQKRLNSARADAQEMKNAVMRGQLLQEPEVGLVGTTIFSAVKMRVMGLRTLGPLVRATGSDAEAADVIEAGARDALSELAGLGDLAREVARSQRAGAAAGRDDRDGGDASAEADDERVGGSGAEALA